MQGASHSESAYRRRALCRQNGEMRRIRRTLHLCFAVALAAGLILLGAPSEAEAHPDEITAPWFHVGGGAGFYQGTTPRPHFEGGAGFHTFLFYASGGVQVVWNKPGPYVALGAAIPIPIVRPLIGVRFGWADLADSQFTDFSLHVQIGAIVRKPKFPLAFMFTVDPGGWGLVKAGGFSGSNHSLRLTGNLVIYPPLPPGAH